MLEAHEIQQIIPHRYPFLLIDRILELTADRAVGIKNVSVNEPFFQGHFPGQPVMPGVLIVEALAQVGAVALLSDEADRGKLVLFAGIDGLRFRKPVRPGDQLHLEVTLTKRRGPIGKAIGKAYVGEALVCEGELTFAMSS